MVDLAAKNDKLSDDTFAVAFEKKCVGANIDAVVFNKYGKVIIEVENTPDEEMADEPEPEITM